MDIAAKIKPAVLLGFCLFAAGCATPEQIEMQRQMQDKADFDTCVSYGLRPGSEAFGMCRLEIDLARQEQYNDRATYYGGYGYGHHGHSHAGSYIGLGF